MKRTMAIKQAVRARAKDMKIMSLKEHPPSPDCLRFFEFLRRDIEKGLGIPAERKGRK